MEINSTISEVVYHVYPIHDMDIHDLEGYHCKCGPSVLEDGRIVVHNSFDGREFQEGSDRRN